MIVVTGAAGFIGSNLVKKLNNEGLNELILVDDFTKQAKENNLKGKKFSSKIERDKFLSWFEETSEDIEFVFHIGARTDTSEFDKLIFDELNLNYSKEVWRICASKCISMIYASSAATYGAGEFGYSDNHEVIENLKPLNPYGESKNDFDKWALVQEDQPPYWAGMKFFNVYGPNEYHKNRMASVVFHAFNQIVETGKLKLFRSHNPEFNDGEQKRDFVYVKDVVDVLYYLMREGKRSGIMNLGTGKARTFLDLGKSVFRSMGIEENIEFIDTPEDIRDTYQYFTQARMDKLFRAGYDIPFHPLEQGIDDYVKNYLSEHKYN
ncbi:MAG: ADP-glyceromanno-heptose 6-epimerase [Bacteroidales bacterium]|nr:ADP-glyceromanno-heptose 6-epimerase [Bacteroidales bacterium]